MSKLPKCDRAQHNVCCRDRDRAVQSNGVGVEFVPSALHDCDRSLNDVPNEMLDEENLSDRKPAGVYNGELILQPQQRFDWQQQLNLLDWHPLFTGRCPNCERSMATEASRLHWDCEACGWVDDSI